VVRLEQNVGFGENFIFFRAETRATSKGLCFEEKLFTTNLVRQNCSVPHKMKQSRRSTPLRLTL
jgi:hypothetical protein